MSLTVLPANGGGAYNITDSLRFRKSATAYLSRTPASASNRKTWTWSAWIKRGALPSSTISLFGSGTGGGDYCYFGFTSNHILQFQNNASGGNQINATTPAVFRDVSAWYHIILSVDTTQATNSNGVKIYINGVQQTLSFGSYTQNTDTLINNTNTHVLGDYISGGSLTFDGYMAEVNFVDGQALTPSDFGETNADGVWSPKAYTGTYGTNGFYLPFNYEPTSTHDIFGDSSAKATYMLDANANDLGGSYNGTANNLTYAAGKFGQAGLFNGSTSNVILPNNTLGATSAHSVSLWFKISATGLFRYIIANRNATKTYSIGISATNKVVFGDWQGSGSNLTGTNTVTDGNWHHLVYINNNGSITGYIDGVQDAALTGSHTNVAQSLANGVQIGNWDYDNSSSFSGSIDHVRAFNRVLTASEVTTLYNETEYSGFTADQSGNGNHWQSNNISTVAGTTYDLMSDTPTLTDEDTGNFATLNPLSETSNLSTSEANLAVANSTTETQHRLIRATMGMSTGKYYWEVHVNNSAYVDMVGIINSSYNGSDNQTVNASNGFGYGYSTSTGNWYTGTGWTNDGTTPSAFPSSGIIGVAFDADNGKLYFSRNNTWINSANPSAGTGANATYTGSETEFLPALSIYYNTGTWRVNFGQRPFAYTPPTGFKKLNTYNLPDSSIKDGSKYMNTLTWTGNATARSITGLGFSPDLVWIKNRGTAYGHVLQDTIRGTSVYLASNSTDADTAASLVTSFDSDGFSLSTSNVVNQASTGIVGWSWRGSDSSAVSNTDGTITSTVSANTTSGFSVVTYTSQTSGVGTVGHGLGVAPSLIITKNRSGTIAWNVYHSSLGATQYIILNTTAASVTSSVTWNNTEPTSSVFTFGTGFANSGTYVAYCFAEVEGFSKFGSYTGNGSTDGPFVYTGFRPAFVIIKAEGIGNWSLFDSTRGSYNVIQPLLLPNTSDSEYTVTNPIDFVSNGFKIRDTNTQRNNSGSSYIYMAFAENPFKNSLAR